METPAGGGATTGNSSERWHSRASGPAGNWSVTLKGSARQQVGGAGGRAGAPGARPKLGSTSTPVAGRVLGPQALNHRLPIRSRGVGLCL